MNSTVFGLIYLVIGIGLLLWGANLAKIVIALWGLGVGLWLGQAIVSGQNLPNLWSSIIVWGIGIVAMIVAYAFYQLGLAILIAFTVYWVASALLSFLNLGTTITVLVAGTLAVLGGFYALRSKLSHLVLAIISSIIGAGYTLCGVLVLVDGNNTTQIGYGPISFVMHQSTIWIIAFVALAVIGSIIQNGSQTTDYSAQTT
jgi:hypothetical protein